MHFKKVIAGIMAACMLTLTVFAQSVYTVKKGDTMWKIASAKQVSVSDILKANPQVKNPSAIVPGQKLTIPNGSSATTLEDQVITLVNKQRAMNGLQPLTKNWTLAKMARCKSQDMVTHNYFSHTSPTYGSPFTMMQNFGINFTAAGENIAEGQPTPQAVMNAWMNSPGHRANILSPAYNQIGVGMAKTSNGVIYWTQDFIKAA